MRTKGIWRHCWWFVERRRASRRERTEDARLTVWYCLKNDSLSYRLHGGGLLRPTGVDLIDTIPWIFGEENTWRWDAEIPKRPKRMYLDAAARNERITFFSHRMFTLNVFQHVVINDRTTCRAIQWSPAYNSITKIRSKPFAARASGTQLAKKKQPRLWQNYCTRVPETMS